MEAIDSTSPELNPKRPTFLLVICILSFIYLAFDGLGIIGGYVTGPDSAEAIKVEKAALDKQMDDLEAQGATEWKPTIEKFKNMIVTLNRNFYYVQALNILIFIVGVTGVVFMFIGRKLGFHLYIIYSLLSVCSYYFFMSPASVPTIIIVFSGVISGLFVFLYSRNLKWMR